MLLAPSPLPPLLLLLLFLNPTQAQNPPDNTQPAIPTPAPRRRLPPLNLALPLIPLTAVRRPTPPLALPTSPSQPTNSAAYIDPDEPVALVDEITSPRALAAIETFLTHNPSVTEGFQEYAPRCIGVTPHLRDTGTDLPSTILFSLFSLELPLSSYLTPQDLCAAAQWGGAARSLGGTCVFFPTKGFPGLPAAAVGVPVFVFKPGVRDEAMVGAQRLREFCTTVCGCEEAPDLNLERERFREHVAGTYFEPFEGYVWLPKVGKKFFRNAAVGGLDWVGNWKGGKKEGKEGKEDEKCRRSRCWSEERVGGVQWAGQIGRAEGRSIWLGGGRR